jgi:hypothetical protein
MPPLPLLGAVALILVYATLRIGSGGHNGGPLFWLEMAILGGVMFLMRMASERRLQYRRFQRFSARRAVVLMFLAPLTVFLILRVMSYYLSALAQATNGVE